MIKIRTRLKEATQSPLDQTKQFKVILIQEGLGNLRDCFYYTRDCLQDAVQNKIFEGKKCYADHPTAIGEQIQPERSTRDIIGYFEQVQFEEDGLGRGMITGTLCVPVTVTNDWALSLMANSVAYAQKYQESEFVGLSINANGEAQTVSIDDFLKLTKIPAPILDKLSLAQQEGITEIRPVSQLTEAVSCDLVTEAGAGGKILKMIEGDKKMKQKKEDEKMKQAVPPATADDKATPMAPKSDGGDDAGHDDAAQDQQLFAKMIKQYLGDDHPTDEESMKMAQHAYEAHKEDGMSHEEAYHEAGKHLKMALAIGKKMAQAAAAPAQPAAQEAGAEEDMEKKEKHTESSSSIRLNARIAKLEDELKKYQLSEYLDKKLSESKKPNSVTRKFREALGIPKSKTDIDTAWKFFIKAYEAGSEEVESDSGFVFTEKKTTFKADGEGKIGSFTDCLE